MSDGPRYDNASKPLRTVIEGELLLHKEIWLVVERQLANADSSPHGSFYDDLTAMVFMSHALEGYLNFVGERIAPEFWKEERRHFRSSGFAGKAAKVFELCGLMEPEKGKRPYATVWELKVLRDQIAHPKTTRYKIEIEHGHHDVPKFNNHNPLTDVITHVKAVQSADDVRQIINLIHQAARPILKHDYWFGNHGLGGNVSHSSYFTGANSF